MWTNGLFHDAAETSNCSNLCPMCLLCYNIILCNIFALFKCEKFCSFNSTDKVGTQQEVKMCLMVLTSRQGYCSNINLKQVGHDNVSSHGTMTLMVYNAVGQVLLSKTLNRLLHQVSIHINKLCGKILPGEADQYFTSISHCFR